MNERQKRIEHILRTMRESDVVDYTSSAEQILALCAERAREGLQAYLQRFHACENRT